MEEVALRPITLSDTDLIVRWRNSDAVRLNMYDQRILTAEQHRNYFHQYIEQGIITQYIIEVDNQQIGTIFSKKIDDGVVELGMFIGEEGYRGHGYGRIALSKLLAEVKKDNSVHFATLKVRNTNLNAIRLYESLGFHYDGNETEHFIKMVKI